MENKISYKPVDGSSSVKGYNYVRSTEKLYIKFNNEREYVYEGVSEEEYNALIAEGSSFGKVLYATVINKKKFEEIW